MLIPLKQTFSFPFFSLFSNSLSISTSGLYQNLDLHVDKWLTNLRFFSLLKVQGSFFPVIFYHLSPKIWCVNSNLTFIERENVNIAIGDVLCQATTWVAGWPFKMVILVKVAGYWRWLSKLAARWHIWMVFIGNKVGPLMKFACSKSQARFRRIMRWLGDEPLVEFMHSENGGWVSWQGSRDDEASMETAKGKILTHISGGLPEAVWISWNHLHRVLAMELYSLYDGVMSQWIAMIKTECICWIC